MKTLTIVRHAKSSWDVQGLADQFRPLNERGYHDGHNMALWYANYAKHADMLISSPAVRAYTTAMLFASALRYPMQHLIIEPLLFHATPETIENVVYGISESADTAMIFGHNPGFTWFSNSFLDQPVDNLPTCGVVILKSNAETWSAFQPGSIETQHYMSPKKLYR